MKESAYIIIHNDKYFFKCFGCFGFSNYTTNKMDARKFDTRKEAQCFCKTMLNGKHKIVAI